MASEETAGLLAAQITALDKNLNKRLDDLRDNLTTRLNQQDRQMNRVEAKVDKTNGRVTDLEGDRIADRERSTGFKSAFKWIPPGLMILLSTGSTIAIMALTGTIH